MQSVLFCFFGFGGLGSSSRSWQCLVSDAGWIVLDCRTTLVLVLEVPHFGCCLVVLDCSKRLVLEVLISDAGWTVLDCRTMAGFIHQVFGAANLLFQPVLLLPF